MSMTSEDHFMPDALFWAKNTDPTVANDDTGDQLWDAEVRLLSASPQSPAEMIVQLEIICEGLEGGGRSDGLDVLALRNIQTALATQEAHEQARLRQFNILRSKTTPKLA